MLNPWSTKEQLLLLHLKKPNENGNFNENLLTNDF